MAGAEVRLWLLGSGSKGNAVLLECGETRVLIDAGFSARRLAGRLRGIGIAPESIDALVLTHEHGDHVSGVESAVRRWGWPIYATPGTIAALYDLPVPGRSLASGMRLTIGQIELLAVPVSHDAAEPVAFVATSSCSGMRAAIVTDLGVVTPAVAEAVRGVELLVLESNHDEMMLRNGPYPWHLKRRVASNHGHLSNVAAAHLIAAAAHRGLQGVVLAHLSETNNTPRIALDACGSVVRRTRWRGRVTAAPQHGVVGPFGDVGAVGGQLALGL